jgi:hypothetical protein
VLWVYDHGIRIWIQIQAFVNIDLKPNTRTGKLENLTVEKKIELLKKLMIEL